MLGEDPLLTFLPSLRECILLFKSNQVTTELAKTNYFMVAYFFKVAGRGVISFASFQREARSVLLILALPHSLHVLFEFREYIIRNYKIKLELNYFVVVVVVVFFLLFFRCNGIQCSFKSAFTGCCLATVNWNNLS